MSLKLPKFEMYEEGRQIRKSSKSVKDNIVEALEEEDTNKSLLDFLHIQ